MVSAGHYLAAAAGVRILEKGGNAFDAGVAAALCINVLQTDLTNIGGVAPACLYRADTRLVETVSGLGWWPAAADADLFRNRYGGRIPRGIHRCVMPAAMDSWLTILGRHGTMRFAEVAEAAIDLAENGFPMHSLMHETFSRRGRAQGDAQLALDEGDLSRRCRPAASDRDSASAARSRPDPASPGCRGGWHQRP